MTLADAVPATASAGTATDKPSVPMTQARTVSPKTLSAKQCTCLQQHAKLLGNPKLSEILSNNSLDESSLSIDKAFSLAQQGMQAWQNLITCPHCPYNDDSEVMFLTFMSIRAVTRYLQHLSPLCISGPGSESNQDSSPLTIGSFEITGEDRMLMLRILFQNTLQKLKSMLRSLQLFQDHKKRKLLEETSNRTAGYDDYQASNSLLHIQQISHKIVTTLESLESSLNEKQDTPDRTSRNR